MKKRTKPEAVNPGSKNSMVSRASISKTGRFPVVGIGASAGGLEALEQFFSFLPANSGMAFVVIQHLDPNHKGMMRELLQQVTQMKVHTVTDRIKVIADNVYLIPPNKSMSIFNGALYLFEPLKTRGLRLPIDYFFRSLADEMGHSSIGIILSGMGSDGSMGIKAIKENSGIVLVQEPASAKFDSMPRSAIDSVMADIIAPANELPAKLIAIVKHDPVIISEKGTGTEKDTSALEKITILIRAQTGHDFSQYKKNTVYRRIERRMGIHQIRKISSYVRYLQENPEEIEILFKELLIGVTSFFRDMPVWEKMKENVIPSMIVKYTDKHILKAWIPGCSTGEEAYSLAIIYKEVMEKNGLKNSRLQIFATDIDNNAVEKARKGIFNENIVSDVSPERLKRFFTLKENQYVINPEIREMVVFAAQNVTRDPPFTKLDLLICRNLLIYMDIDLQKKLLALFHYSLKTNGIMVLGSAENIGSLGDFFHAVDSKLKIYQRFGPPLAKELLEFPGIFAPHNTEPDNDQILIKVPDNLQTLTDQLLLQEFSPASVLVTDLGDIIYITGSTGKYLAPAAGKANMNLFAMAREGFRNELPVAFRKALQTYEKVFLNNVRVGTEGGTLAVDITLQQLEKPKPLKGRILVIFTDKQPANSKSARSESRKPGKSSGISGWELEMQRIKEELQNTREEMRTSQEELKSTNEELQSTNEELQSTNEELTTSKEEMQSLNEELHTVNIELQGKIDDSARINNDMNNLLNSIEIAALFLDKELKIRQFTPQVTRIFKLLPSDVGRLYTDQVSELNYHEMYDDANEVLQTLVYKEKAISTRDGRWYTVRIMPYRTSEDKIEGLVITFIDITRAKNLEKALQNSGTMLRSLIRAVPGIILGLSSGGNIIEFNQEAELVFGCNREEVIGKNYFDLFVPKSSRKKVETDINRMLQGVLPNRYENTVRGNNGKEFLIEWSAQKLLDDNSQQVGIIAIGVKKPNE